MPGSTFAGIVLPEHPDQAARVVVSEHGARTRVYVHPDTLEILKTADEGNTLERAIFKLHGELMMGKGGSIMVELAASWAIVMILTGLYLWWPRNAKGLGGVLYPRIGQGAKRSGATCMPWSASGSRPSRCSCWSAACRGRWCGATAFKKVRAWTGTAAISQDWITSSADEHAEHCGHDAMTLRAFRGMTRGDASIRSSSHARR